MSEGRADFNGKNYEDMFIGDLVTFVAGEKFQKMFENFFIEHAMEFTNTEEHKLEWYDIYQKFHTLFEMQLEEFCEDRGLSQAEFMVKCREASTEDPKAKHYISILLSSVEYDTFVKLMKIMRPVAERRLAATALVTAAAANKAEAKADGVDVKGTDAPAAEGSEGKGVDIEPVASPEKASAKSIDPDEASGSKGLADDEVADAKGEAKRSMDEDDNKGSK